MAIQQSALSQFIAAVLCRLDSVTAALSCLCGQSPRQLHACHLRREYSFTAIPVATVTKIVLANPERVYLSIAMPVTTGTMWVSTSMAMAPAVGILVTQDTGGRIEVWDAVHRTLQQADWFAALVGAGTVHVQEVICGKTVGPLPPGANELPICP